MRAQTWQPLACACGRASPTTTTGSSWPGVELFAVMFAVTTH